VVFFFGAFKKIIDGQLPSLSSSLLKTSVILGWKQGRKPGGQDTASSVMEEKGEDQRGKAFAWDHTAHQQAWDHSVANLGHFS
jgi:hypothetical protein